MTGWVDYSLSVWKRNGILSIKLEWAFPLILQWTVYNLIWQMVLAVDTKDQSKLWCIAKNGPDKVVSNQITSNFVNEIDTSDTGIVRQVILEDTWGMSRQSIVKSTLLTCEVQPICVSIHYVESHMLVCMSQYTKPSDRL